MRKFLTLLLIISFFTAYSAPITLKVANGSWIASSWDLNRLPANGDNIIIPANTTLTLDKDVSLSNVQMEISGSLVLAGNNMKLVLDNASKLIVNAGGTIQGSKNSQHILLNNLIYQGDKGVVLGPKIATGTSGGFILMPAPIVPLPVKFVGFSAARKSADVLVQWATSQEINADFYQVERSEDGQKWKSIGKVKAAGTTNYTTNYSYTDQNVAQNTVYYRIKQVDVDGRFEYTAIKSVKGDSNTNVNAVAANGNIVLQFSKQVAGQVEVRLVSLSGQVISRQYLNKPIGQLVIPAAVKGHFVLTVSDLHDIQINKQILL